jgi:glycosyltransferase involved in cell wall biosynthesis
MSQVSSMAVVAAVNDDRVLANNLASSPFLSEYNVPLIAERGYDSASKAYNAGLERASAEIVIFAHQDVYLPRGWEKRLLSTIRSLESDGRNWGVLGVIGKNRTGNLVGRVWSTGLQLKIETEFSSPTAVWSVDELVIVLRKSSGLRFDINLPGFHLYGTDIVQSALKVGLGAYVFNGPVIHNSLRCIKLGQSYSRAYQYMQRKWSSELPLYTTVLPITQSDWPLIRNWLNEKKENIIRKFKKVPPRERDGSPLRLAQELGYEYDGETRTLRS